MTSLLTLLGILTFPLPYLILFAADKRLTLLTPAYLFAGIYTLFLLLGSLIGYPSTLYPLVYIGLASFSAGVYFVSRIAGLTSDEIKRYLAQPLTVRYDTWASKLSLAIFATVAFFGSLLYFAAHGVPLLASQTEQTRLASVSGSNYWFHFIATALPVVVALAWLHLRRVNTVYSLSLGVAIVTIAATLMIATAFRSLIAHLLIILLIVDQFYTRGLDYRKLTAVTVSFIGLFIIISAQRYSGDAASMLGFAVRIIKHRILMVNLENIAFIFSFFPTQHPYLLGQSYLFDIGSISPGPDIAFGGWLMNHYQPGLGHVGMTPTIVGEAYANFGYLGIVCYLFGTGVIIELLFVALVRQPAKCIEDIALFTVTTLFLAKTVTNGFGMISITKFIPLTFTYLALRAAERVGQIDELTAAVGTSRSIQTVNRVRQLIRVAWDESFSKRISGKLVDRPEQ